MVLQPAPHPEPPDLDAAEAAQLAPVEAADEKAREHEKEVDADPARFENVVSERSGIQDALADGVDEHNRDDGGGTQQVEVGDSDGRGVGHRATAGVPEGPASRLMPP